MRATDVVGGRYRLVERLGEGGFGEVWRAEQLVAGEAVADVAVKGLRAGADLREIRLLARLSHPHVLRFRDAFDDDGRLYLVTDLAEGGSAADLQRTYQGGVPGPEVARVVREAAEGLAYLHGQRVVHRDVKPANLLFVEGRVVVGDVGLAKATEHSLSRHSGQGSMAYAAPETFDGQVGPPSDVYGLAVAAYELLTGRLPFEGTDKQIMMGHVAKAVVVPEGVSGPWRELLLGCLAKEPGERWTLERVRGWREESPRPVEPPRRPQGPSSRLVTPAPGRIVPSSAPVAGPARPAQAPAGPRIRRVTLPGGIAFDLARIGPGRFVMGSPEDEEGRDDYEGQHEVVLTRPYELGVVPVTQALYQAVVGANPSTFKGAERPVEQVSWHDAAAFCNALSRKEGLTAAYRIAGEEVTWDRDAPGYRLPTEAEWEYACRAGTKGPRYGELDSVAWYHGNSGSETHPVGGKERNALGLHDMLGNVWEWCWDWFDVYPGGVATDPAGPAEGSYRVCRGGSWYSDAGYARAAYRNYWSPGIRYDNLGFRLSRLAP